MTYKSERDIFSYKNFRVTFAALIVVASFAFVLSVKAQGVDTSAPDAQIKAALAKVKSPNSTDADKRALAQAYLERANIYYNAGIPTLYKLALGDLRRALRYDPDNAEAHEKAEMIISIYKSMGRPIPPNGSDPKDDGVETKERAPNEDKPKVGNGAGAEVESGGVAQRVRFSNNRSTRTLRGTLNGEMSAKYLVAAQQGQKISVRVASPEKNVSVKIYNARTKAILKDASGVRDWTGDAPESGDYLIEINTTQRGVAYAIEVAVAMEKVEIRSY